MGLFKTSKKNRTTYIYRSATGEKIEITPDDVGEAWIALLHEEDDAMIDADRREQYHAPVHYDSLTNADGDADGLEEKLDILADPSLDPAESLAAEIEAQEHQETLGKLRDAIQTLQPQQQDLVHKVFVEKRSCKSIAEEDGVSKAAVSNRLKKVYSTLGKKLKE